MAVVAIGGRPDGRVTRIAAGQQDGLCREREREVNTDN